MFGSKPSKTLPPPMVESEKVYCCFCKYNGVTELYKTPIADLSKLGEFLCLKGDSVGSWYSPTIPSKYYAMVDKNCNNDCKDYYEEN